MRMQQPEAGDADDDYDTNTDTLAVGTSGAVHVQGHKQSSSSLATRNAELQYQNSLLHVEIMRLHEALRRSGRPPLPPPSPGQYCEHVCIFRIRVYVRSRARNVL